MSLPERSVREAERFLYRLAADSLRREALDDCSRAAKRTAFG